MSTTTTAAGQLSSKLDSLRIPDGERDTTGGNSRLVRFLLFALLAAAVGGGYVAYNRNPQLLQQVVNRGSEFDTATVASKGNEDVALDLSGYVIPYRKVTVSARVPGTIVNLTFDVGQTVKQGDLLAQLDDSNFQLDLQQASAAAMAAESRLEEMQNGALPEDKDQAKTAVEIARSKMEQAKRELDREKQISDSSTQSQLEQLENLHADAQANVRTLEQKLRLLENGPRPERIKGAEADVAQSQALVAKAKKNIENAKILAPLTGTVLEKNAEVGEILRPEGLSSGLCLLADLSTMEVEIDVQERDLHKIDIGRTCRVIPDAYDQRTYAAKVERITPQVSRQRGVVRVTLRITEPDRYLIPEMNVRAIIDSAPVEGPVTESLWIPEAAIITEGEHKVAFVLEGDTAHRREVTLGDKEGKKVQVTAGLKSGDVVVIPGGKRLADGQTIRRKTKS